MGTAEVEFQYTWDGDPAEQGLSDRAIEQIRKIVSAVQTKRQDVQWPQLVVVDWQTRSLNYSGTTSEDASIRLRFRDGAAWDRILVELTFRYPKAGHDLPADQYADKILKN